VAFCGVFSLFETPETLKKRIGTLKNAGLRFSV
jgi:hypothetical protein